MTSITLDDSSSNTSDRSGATGLAAPVLAGPIFPSPAIYFIYSKLNKNTVLKIMVGHWSISVQKFIDADI